MQDFVLEYLNSSNNSSSNSQKEKEDFQQSTSSYLIAIPVETCHELLLELESVQRGILYHCPLLVHSCISAAATRLPLLYVESSSDINNNLDAATALDQLEGIVEAAVKEHVVQKRTPPVATSASNENDDDDKNLAESQQEPPALSLQFQGLEIEGGARSPNQVLLAAAVKNLNEDSSDDGIQTLRRLVAALQSSIPRALPGWSTRLPEEIVTATVDENGIATSTSAARTTFRPRIPFMRLPDNWNSLLKQQQQQKSEKNDNDDATDGDDDDDSAVVWLTADEGGNGISPIHWGKWADDVLGGPQRLRQVAIYPRRRRSVRSASNIPEVAFPWPAVAIPLPDGTDAAQIRAEAAFAEYQERRLEEAEASLKRMGGSDKDNGASVDASSAARVSEDDLLLSMTRHKLERIYGIETAGNMNNDGPEKKQSLDNADDGLIVNVEIEKVDWDDIQSDLLEEPQRPSAPDSIDDWTRRRIEKAVMSRARFQSELELAKKKDKPPIAQNSVFAKYKDGSLVPEQDKVLDVAARELPPFPSTEHCTGFWRMLSSPTGFDLEEGDASRCDNLILRVDGTIAGGPILDQETRQKASGGSWSLDLQNEDEPTLQINLLIPLKKDRVLVMKGRLSESQKAMHSLRDVPLASNTFGIPALEERRRAATAAATDHCEDETMIRCKGSVWIEDAETKRNRDDVGSFSILKLNTPTDPSQFTITIPRNVRNQD